MSPKCLTVVFCDWLDLVIVIYTWVLYTSIASGMLVNWSLQHMALYKINKTLSCAHAALPVCGVNLRALVNVRHISGGRVGKNLRIDKSHLEVCAVL